MKTIIFLVLSFFIFGCSGSDSKPQNTVQNEDNQSQSTQENNETNSIQSNEYDSLGNESEYADRYKTVRSHPSNFNLGSSQDQLHNREAPITPMCYTKHDKQYNPCYVCHQSDKRVFANWMDDGGLQNVYAFSTIGQTNHWSNLFTDKSERVASISDESISQYVNSENYTALKVLLENNSFIGYIPDLNNLHLAATAFDKDGFALDGSGWVAFNYKPLPSTFWPVNGSTDDVMIRLAKKFRQNEDGNYSRTVYQFNLAIVEMAIKNINTISVNDLDENLINTDLNGDGILGIVSEINLPDSYVGKGSDSTVEIAMYPRYTEFLHSVRYVGIDENEDYFNAPRMKELRYMIKVDSYDQDVVPYNRTIIASLYDDEAQDKIEGNLPSYSGLGEKGIDNKHGWMIQGFIEDAQGGLRPQTYEETFFCMGCHTTIGSTIDKTFSFARKIDGVKGWGYINLRNMVDAPNKGEELGEIATYLQRVGGGNEFRVSNDMNIRYFDNGEVNLTKVSNTPDVYELLRPSKNSALQMAKAYKVIVEDQKFIYGRDANTQPMQNVYRSIDDETPTLPSDKQYKWDIRLDWSEQQ